MNTLQQMTSSFTLSSDSYQKQQEGRNTARNEVLDLVSESHRIGSTC